MKSLILTISTITAFYFSANAELIKIVTTGTVSKTANTSIDVGTSVKYTFLFDTELDGLYIINNIKYPIYDLDNTNYFYADFLGDYVLSDYMAVNSEHNYGYEYTGDTPVVTVILGGTHAHRVQIISNCSFDTWGIGTKFMGIEQSLNNNNTWLSVFSDLQITEFASVPEPSLIFMMLSGVGLISGFISRSLRKVKIERFRKKSSHLCKN